MLLTTYIDYNGATMFVGSPGTCSALRRHWVRVMMFSTTSTFNNISVISQRFDAKNQVVLWLLV